MRHSLIRRLLAASAPAALAAGLMLAQPYPALALDASTAAQNQAPAALEPAPLGFQRRVLPNGMEVYTARDTSTSNVTVNVWYRVGAKDDPAGRSGFAHLFEHMLFKATRNMPPETFDRLTEDVGGFNNATTYDDFTAYYEVVPANHLQRILWAEADRLRSLVVDQDILTSERDVVKEEYRQRYIASPYGRLFGLFLPQTIYREHPYRRPGIGSLEELNAATVEDVRRFHATYYRPDNAFIVVAGNFDQAQLDAWINQYFGDIQNPSTPIPANDVSEPELTTSSDQTFYAPNVPLPAVLIAWQTVPWGHPDRAALTVLDGILSTGESSRLYRSLVYNQEIAAQTSSIPDFAQQAGNLSAYAIMAEGHTIDEGLAALRAEVARFRDEPVTAAELDEAKNELIANALRERETVDQRAFAFGYALTMTGDPAAADREIGQIQAVTAADIQRVARRYLTENRMQVLRYLASDEQNPETIQNKNVDAPVTLASLTALEALGEPTTLAAEGEREPIPAPGPAVEPATPTVADFRLDNGLRVLVAPRRGLPLVSAQLSFDAGASDDPLGKPGVASLTAALLSQGAGGRSAPEIATEIERLGASVSAGSGVDFTTISGNAPSNVFPQVLNLMADLAQRPAFEAEELERLRSQTMDGLRLALSQPGSVASQATARVIYGGAPYGQPASGTLNSVPAITREDVTAYHAAHFRPSEAVLTFSGDIDEATARRLAEQAFGGWRDPAGAAPAAADPSGPEQSPRIIVVDMPGAGQAAVITAMRSIRRTDPDYFALSLGNTLLGGGYSSRLNQEVRIRRGLSYGAGTSIGSRQDEGVFTASTQTRNDAADEVVELMLQEIGKMGQQPITEAELAPRRAVMTGGFGRSLETVDGLGGLVANLALYDLPMSELAAYAGRVRAVTPEEVQAAFAQRLPVGRASIVVVGDASQFLEQLRAAHPNVEVIPLSELNLDSATLR
ncbi:pitrilysin family protein [Brevundimonas sp. 2R-24]|uniref:Pitrilysin family protein n=1 Tax=Peiella sedimenti TaxID=3061083 RepID=A0ABT8SN72_9CAUL|nr:pitrilysin family protein [Caulobacteraceae bacterium XZ-24]